MSLLRDSTLLRIRRKVTPTFDEGMCEIWRSGAPVLVPGGTITKPTQTRVINQETGTVAFPCRISYIGFNSKREKLQGGKMQEVADYMISLPVFTEVRLSDVIVYIGRQWSEGNSYFEGLHTGPTPSNGYKYLSVLGGIAGVVEPVWPLLLGQDVVDGTVTWRNDGPLPRLEVAEIVEPKTFEVTRQVLCNVIKPN